MKKLLIPMLFLPQLLSAQKVERYCELVATAKLFSSKVSIAVDFGDEAGLFKDHRIKDDDGKVVQFNTLVDALNYMGSQE